MARKHAHIIILLAVMTFVLGFGSNCPLVDRSSHVTHHQYSKPRQTLITNHHQKSHGSKHGSGKETSEFKIAFVGDQGLGKRSKQVMKMMKNWGAQMLVLSGDFDYLDAPKLFIDQFHNVLGKRFMMLAAVGNHDIIKWFEPITGYKARLMKQLAKSGLERHCTGEYGVNMYCIYNDMIFVISGVGTLG